jgi:hypothetical protein
MSAGPHWSHRVSLPASLDTPAICGLCGAKDNTDAGWAALLRECPGTADARSKYDQMHLPR